MVTFGEWVRQHRARRKLTRAELAERVGCSVAMLRKIEGDERRPSAQIAELIASAFEIPDRDRTTFVRVARRELGTDRLPEFTTSGQPAEALAASPLPRNPFPLSPSPLIGRERELLDLGRLLRDPQCRFLTLVGTGGAGKTRLACELALQHQGQFSEGICFVPLSAANSIRLLVPIIADSLGFVFQGGDLTNPKAQLFGYLRDRQMLLLLDNIEHLLAEPGIEILAELLAAAPQIKLLVTSRESLNLQQEQVFELQGLPIPGNESHANTAPGTSVELFLQRARRAHAAFDATSEDYPTIVRICRVVEGIPLAIELAAAWVRSLTCAEIATELEKGLDLLSTSARDIAPGHRSMRAVFDRSWGLLAEQEQRALCRLSVFRSGFDREAAEYVAGAPLPMVSALVAKSLVRRTAAGRYDLHELVRQYAALHLDADPAAAADARHRHCDFFVALAESAELQLKGRNQLEWLRRLDLEHNNLRAALGCAFTSDGGIDSPARRLCALRLAGALRWFWRMRSYFGEGQSWISRILNLDSSGPAGAFPDDSAAIVSQVDRTALTRARARALVGLALLTDSISDHPTALRLALESAALFSEVDDKDGLAEALMLVGQSLRWQGQVAQGRERMQEALSLYRELGDRWGTAQALYRLGADLSDFERDAVGRLMLEESAAILEDLGDRFLSVNVLIAGGLVTFGLGDFAAAEISFKRALELAVEVGDPWGMADALTNIGCTERVRGNYAEAQRRFEAALKVYRDWGSGGWCADPLCALAENSISQGHLAAAASYLEEARRFAGASENSWLKVLVSYFRGLLAFYQADLDEAAAILEQTAALARASQYKPDLARSLVTLGRTFTARGEPERARPAIVEGMIVFWDFGCQLGIATAFEALAKLAPPQRAERAARLLGTADAVRRSIGAPLPPIDRGELEHDSQDLRTRLGEVAFAEAWARGRDESPQVVVAEILEIFGSSHPEYLVADAAPGSVPPKPSTALGAS